MKFHIAAIFLITSELFNLTRLSHGLVIPPWKNPSTSRLHSTSSYSSELDSDESDDRIFKAGGGVPRIPSGELKLFDPGEQGMKGGTLDLEERLKNGASYLQTGTIQNGDESASPQEKLALSLFDPGQEGMKGGTSDFAERLKSGVNFQQAKEKAWEAASQTAASFSEPMVAEVTPEELPAPPEPKASNGLAPARNVGRRANWPYEPMISSSSYSPAYPNVGVGRGRATAIRKHHQEIISNTSTAPIAAVKRTPGAGATAHSPDKGPAAADHATTSTIAAASTNGSATVDTKSKKPETKVNRWGSKSNWWDNASLSATRSFEQN